LRGQSQPNRTVSLGRAGTVNRLLDCAEMVELEADEQHEDHPCTALELIATDKDLLAYMLQDVRVLARQVCAGEVLLQRHETVHWQVHGLARRAVICDPGALAQPVERCIVGFFGERRPDAQQSVVDDIEVDLLFEFRSYPGILSYSSTELVDNYWANLVIHAEPSDSQDWRKSVVHQRAVAEISPRQYRSVRIHNGRLPGGVVGSEAIRIDRTKFWDYGAEGIWDAVRSYA